jgi:hypothetical protein
MDFLGADVLLPSPMPAVLLELWRGALRAGYTASGGIFCAGARRGSCPARACAYDFECHQRCCGRSSGSIGTTALR